MRNLQQLAQSNLSWCLDEFVQLTDSAVFARNPGKYRVREEVTLAWCGTTAA